MIEKTQTENAHKEKLSIVFSHGSPGSAEDFRHLIDCLNYRKGDLHFEYQFWNRPQNSEVLLEADWLVTYSWGTTEALAELSALLKSRRSTPRLKGLIFISPHLKSKPLSALARILLNTPLLSDVVLKAMAPGIERDFLVKSWPSNFPISESYRIAVNAMMSPLSLKKAALEKSEQKTSLALIGARALSHLPCLIVVGENDLVSPASENVMALQAIFTRSKLEVLKGASHALPWSHDQILSELVSHFISSEKNNVSEVSNEIR